MRWTRLIISFGLSLLFLYLTFFIPQFGRFFAGECGFGEALVGHPRFDISQLGDVLARARWSPIAGAGVLFFTSLAVRAWRWQIMLGPIVRMRFMDVFAAMSIGYMANNVLPFRMGEVYRAHVVFQISGLSRTAAFGSVVLERMTDLFFMMPYALLGVLLYPLPGGLRSGIYLMTGVVVILATLTLWIAFDRRRSLAAAQKLMNVLPKKAAAACYELLERFTSGFDVLKKSEHHIGLVASSLSLWAMYAGMVYCILQSLQFWNSGLSILDANPLAAVLITLIVTTLGFVIPGAPGGVGTYHGMTVIGLSLLAVPGDRAAGFAILLHALNYIPLTVLGLFFFWKLGLSFHGTRDLTAEMHPTASESSSPIVPVKDDASDSSEARR